MSHPQDRYVYVVRKFGSNPDIDTTTTPETVWETGGAYPWSDFDSGALSMTVVSDSANDTAGGTGARTVRFEGLNEDWMPIYSLVPMDGLTPVALGDFFRLFRGRAVTAGSTGSNVGTITVASGGTTYATIQPTRGTSQMAVYTVPTTPWGCEMHSWWATPRRSIASAVEVEIRTRSVHPVGGDSAWQSRMIVGTHSTAYPWSQTFGDVPLRLATGTDIEIVVSDVSANNTVISAGFNIGFLRHHDTGITKQFTDFAEDISP